MCSQEPPVDVAGPELPFGTLDTAFAIRAICARGESGHYSSNGAMRSCAHGGLWFGPLVVFTCLGPLVGCGVADDLASGATITPDSFAPITDDAASVETEAPPATAQPEPEIVSLTSEEITLADTAPPITTIANDTMTSPPVITPAPPVISDASVQALAAVLGVEGELEQRDGEHGSGQCVGRLEPRGLCVNVPLWGVWQYWDLAAQDSPGASNDQARDVAVDLFARLGVDPGTVVSIEPNGPLPQVTLSSGTLVMVAEDGRIASVISGTSLLPAA